MRFYTHNGLTYCILSPVPEHIARQLQDQPRLFLSSKKQMPHTKHMIINGLQAHKIVSIILTPLGINDHTAQVFDTVSDETAPNHIRIITVEVRLTNSLSVKPCRQKGLLSRFRLEDRKGGLKLHRVPQGVDRFHGIQYNAKNGVVNNFFLGTNPY